MTGEQLRYIYEVSRLTAPELAERLYVSKSKLYNSFKLNQVDDDLAKSATDFANKNNIDYGEMKSVNSAISVNEVDKLKIELKHLLELVEQLRGENAILRKIVNDKLK